MELMRGIRRTLGWGIVAYTSLYGASTYHVAYDFSSSHSRWLHDNAKNELVIKNFSSTIDGKVRDITIAGETHDYNEKESDFAKDLIRKFNLVMHEGGYTQKATFIDKAFLKSVGAFAKVTDTYIHLGDGRFTSNPGFDELAYQNRTPVLYLENRTAGGTSEFNLEQKTKLLWFYFKGAAMGPILYYQSKDSVMHKEEINEDTVKEVKKLVNVDRRNVQMAQEILKYLRSRPEDNILIVVGKDHVAGILHELQQSINLQPRN